MTAQSRKDSRLGMKCIVASCFVFRMRSVNIVKGTGVLKLTPGFWIEENSRRKIYVLEEECQAAEVGKLSIVNHTEPGTGREG